ncbi:P-loop containing nucleoside triphosphate hydrolase protein [Tricladium varicosporioides]|nr:P-loop containing nucleoside triphosphate hydrolase protein [Hymenoscyphus varicosporioides]
MDTNDHFRHPAKRPRLREASNRSQPRQLCMQSSHPTSPSTQQEIINPASLVVPTTGYSDNFNPGFSESGGQWINYAGQIQFTYSEQSNVMMQPPMFPPPGLPHVTGHFPWIPPAPPCPSYVPASLPNHEPIQHSLDTMDRLTSGLELRMIDEPGYRTLAHSQSDVLEESETIGTEIVCFGMSSFDIPSTFSVQIEFSNRFSARDGIRIEGRIPTEYGEMIQGLIDEPTVTLHVSCVVDDKPTAKKPSHKFELLPCVLEITVYGSLEIFEEIGTWFQGYEIYLQDPRSCHMEVKCCNPQRLSAHDLDTCPLLSKAVATRSVLDLQDIVQRPDPLDILSSHIDLEESPQPSQALSFMLHREEGWGFNNGQPDIWEKVDTGQGRVQVLSRGEEPPQFYGGIIADPMGLGKTLAMIALVATDLDTDKGVATPKDTIDHDKCYTSATLVVMPPPLLGSWEEQLSDHVAHGGLKCRRHHVSAEWRPDTFAGSSILFQVCWRRIILDEAHFIRNGNSRMARALCDLDSNRLGDLVSLLKFIRVHPYNDPERFDADISQVWKSGNDQSAIKRLQRLSACLLLRRSKGTIDLPPRRDCILPIQLTHEERAAYNELREQTIIKIDEALHKDSGTSGVRGYVSVLQQIESLRLFCNLGLQYHSRHEKNLQSSDWSRVAQLTFNAQSEMHSITCLQCSSILDVAEGLLNDSAIRQPPIFSSCLRFICSECLSDNRRTSRELTCGHRPSCPMATVSTSSTALEEISDLVIQKPSPMATFTSLPSKVEALITDLQTVPSDIKCIVFSTWRLTLDLIERALDQASLRSIRFDGKVPQRDRQGVIDKFRTDPSIRIMLLTLSCGAVGLTLTVASRAYLMEPHWNPTLEEQALARIYRLGQTRDVTTVRLYVKESFEEQVMQLQESKKNLASVLLSPHDGGQTDNSVGALEVGTLSQNSRARLI